MGSQTTPSGSKASTSKGGGTQIVVIVAIVRTEIATTGRWEANSQLAKARERDARVPGLKG